MLEKETKRDTTSGEFMAQKKDGEKFKGVRQEKQAPVGWRKNARVLD